MPLGIKKDFNFESREGKGLIFFLIVGALILFTAITEGTLFATVYRDIFIFVVGVLALSGIIPSFIEFRSMPSNPKYVFTAILAGFALGLTLVGSNYFAGFSLFSSLNIPDVSIFLGFVGFALIGQLFLISTVVSELEESLISLIRHTVAEWLQRKDLILLVFGILSVLLFFLGFQIYALGAVVLIVLGKNFLLNFFSDVTMRKAGGLIVAAVFFGALHLTAYGGIGISAEVTNALVFNAMLFAVIAGIINIHFDTIIPSKVAHCLNNATVAAIVLNTPLYFAVLVTIIYSVILAWGANVTLKDLKIHLDVF